MKPRRLYEELISIGKQQREKGTDNALIAVEEASRNNQALSMAYYLEGLGYKGLGNVNKSQELFEHALKQYPNNLWAKIMNTKMD